MLLTRMNIGGPARQVLDIAREMQLVIPLGVAAGRTAPDEGEMTDAAVAVTGVPLVRPLSPVLDARALAACRSLLGRRRPGVLHTHMAKAGTLGRLAALSLAPARRPRLVHTFHGHVLDGYFGRRQRDAFLGVERWLARFTDRFIAVSPQVRDELLGLGIGRPEQYEVIPLGLNLNMMLRVGPPGGTGPLRAALSMGPDVPLAICAARLVPIKDHATLLRALREVQGLNLALLGDGELRSSLQQLAHELGVGDRVHFMGWWSDMAGALGDADVVVLASRNEGTPVVLIEALAAARPVVATDVGGTSYVVQHGRTGRLCPPGDEGALAEALKQVLSDKAGAAAMAETGRSVVLERFSLGAALANHLRLYQDLLALPSA